MKLLPGTATVLWKLFVIGLFLAVVVPPIIGFIWIALH